MIRLQFAALTLLRLVAASETPSFRLALGIPGAQAPDHASGIAASICQSLGSSLFTQAPTIPAPILSFEATWIMTATPCQEISPPPTLAPQWTAWTSSVASWLSEHSADYVEYISQCQPWAVAAGNQCTATAAKGPEETVTTTQTVVQTHSTTSTGHNTSSAQVPVAAGVKHGADMGFLWALVLLVGLRSSI